MDGKESQVDHSLLGVEGVCGWNLDAVSSEDRANVDGRQKLTSTLPLMDLRDSIRRLRSVYLSTLLTSVSHKDVRGRCNRCRVSNAEVVNIESHRNASHSTMNARRAQRESGHCRYSIPSGTTGACSILKSEIRSCIDVYYQSHISECSSHAEKRNIQVFYLKELGRQRQYKDFIMFQVPHLNPAVSVLPVKASSYTFPSLRAISHAAGYTHSSGAGRGVCRARKASGSSTRRRVWRGKGLFRAQERSLVWVDLVQN